MAERLLIIAIEGQYSRNFTDRPRTTRSENSGLSKKVRTYTVNEAQLEIAFLQTKRFLLRTCKLGFFGLSIEGCYGGICWSQNVI